MARSGFRLGAVLRARKAQEDVAKAAVIRARTEATDAHQAVHARERDLDARRPPDAASAAAYAATLYARQAVAGALSAAIGVAADADEVVDDRLHDLTDAAVQRRTIEKLQERHDATRKQTRAAAEAKAIDDLTTAAAHARSTEGNR